MTQTKNQQLMTIYKNDPNYEILFTSKKRIFLIVGNVKIRKDNRNAKTHILEFLKKSFQSGVKQVYDRVYKGNSQSTSNFRAIKIMSWKNCVVKIEFRKSEASCQNVCIRYFTLTNPNFVFYSICVSTEEYNSYFQSIQSKLEKFKMQKTTRKPYYN